MAPVSLLGLLDGCGPSLWTSGWEGLAGKKGTGVRCRVTWPSLRLECLDLHGRQDRQVQVAWERMRESVCVCVCVCVYAHTHVCAYKPSPQTGVFLEGNRKFRVVIMT